MYNSFHVFAKWAVLSPKTAPEPQPDFAGRLEELSQRVDQLVLTVARLVRAQNSTKQESGTV